MPALYLFVLENKITFKIRKIAFLCRRNVKDFTLLKKGHITEIFDEKGQAHDKVLMKNAIYIYDTIFNDIIKNRREWLMCSLHKIKGEYFFTMGNTIWKLNSNEFSNDSSSNIVEYNKVQIMNN